MGAYTAVKLLEYYQIRNLMLLVPAMYTSMAYTVPFNKGFTEIIRQPQSWRHSDAWDILSGYRGCLFIIAAENDEVIPQGVINKIYASAVNAKKRRQLSKTALFFFYSNELNDVKARFDVVSISLAEKNPEIEIIKNAFELAYT